MQVIVGFDVIFLSSGQDEKIDGQDFGGACASDEIRLFEIFRVPVCNDEAGLAFLDQLPGLIHILAENGRMPAFLQHMLD